MTLTEWLIGYPQIANLDWGQDIRFTLPPEAGKPSATTNHIRRLCPPPAQPNGLS
mgnify:CR=1 FL=1|jgi:hypothetical protein